MRRVRNGKGGSGLTERWIKRGSSSERPDPKMFNSGKCGGCGSQFFSENSQAEANARLAGHPCRGR